MEYKKKYTDDSGGFVYLQRYNNGYEREVPADRPDLVAWLQTNTPEEITYIEPDPLPLDEYKKEKKIKIGNACISDLMILAGSDSEDSLKYDLINVTAMATALLDKSEKQGLMLTEDEESTLTFLRGLQSAAYNTRLYSDNLKAQVEAATDHDAVDAIVWE